MNTQNKSIFHKGGMLSIILGLTSLVIVIGFIWMSQPTNAIAAPSDLGYIHTQYPAMVNSRIDSCSLCHTAAIPGLNPYGAAYKAAGRNPAAIVAIENLDSDGDGYSNLREIIALTFPGDPNDHPTAVPTPTNTNVPPTATKTNTGVPPTATKTNTGVPPTATKTSTGVPPTATKANTGVPPTATKAATLAPTSTKVGAPTQTRVSRPTRTPTHVRRPTRTPTVVCGDDGSGNGSDGNIRGQNQSINDSCDHGGDGGDGHHPDTRSTPDHNGKPDNSNGQTGTSGNFFTAFLLWLSNLFSRL